MDLREFVEEGYLQEVNRRFLHPLGLALEVRIAVNPDAGDERTEVEYELGGIWDGRDDPEGTIFASGGDAEKAGRVARAELRAHRQREDALGWVVQPLGELPERDEVLDVGYTLRRARLSQGQTLRDVERHTGIHNAHLSQIENGVIRKPNGDLLRVLARYYGLDLTSLGLGA
jgi:hypothetical protein